MKLYIEALNNYLADNEPQYGRVDTGSLLGMLFCCYVESNGVDTNEINAQFDTLYGVLSELSLRKKDQVIDVVCNLCNEHQKASFHQGVLVGFRLYNELHAKVQ